MKKENSNKHYFSYCDHCDRKVVICGTCGNNTCNGGYGQVISNIPGQLMDCPDCKSAYDMENEEYNKN